MLYNFTSEQGLSHIVRALGTSADIVCNAAALVDAAVADERSAGASVLDAAITRARRALSGITRRIERRWVTHVGGFQAIDEYDAFSQYGVVLAGEGRTPIGNRDAGRRPVTGGALMLWEDGSLARLAYTGF